MVRSDCNGPKAPQRASPHFQPRSVGEALQTSQNLGRKLRVSTPDRLGLADFSKCLVVRYGSLLHVVPAWILPPTHGGHRAAMRPRGVSRWRARLGNVAPSLRTCRPFA